MKFNTEAEAYSFYKGCSLDVMEKRAEAIKAEIASNPDADLAGFNVELSGIMAAKREAATPETVEQRGVAVPLDLMNTESKAVDDPAATAEYRSAFFKTMLGRDLNAAEKSAYDAVNAETRANAFNSSTGSAAVIPTETLNEVISKARTMGGIMNVCRSFNMPANIAIPVGTPSSAAAWHTEGAAVDTEKQEPVNVTFGAYEIMKIFSISAAVQTMSIPAFESYLTDELAACVMATLADGLVNGTGTKQGTGVVKGITWADGTNQITLKTDDPTYKDICNLVAMLKRGYATGAKFAMNNATLYSKVYGLTDTTGRPIFVADPKSENVGKILGFEVIVDDFMDDGDILFGNFNYMGYNLPQGIAVESNRYSGFRNGLIDYRALAIADCKPIVDEAFVKITPKA